MPAVTGRGTPRPAGTGRRRQPRRYVLHLYVAGLSPRSQQAIRNLKRICDEHLRGRYRLVIKDIYRNPLFAKDGQIVAAPTLVKKLPLPLRRFVGDMANVERLLLGLDLRALKRGER